MTARKKPPPQESPTGQPTFSEFAQAMGQVKRVRGPSRVDTSVHPDPPEIAREPAAADRVRFVFPIEGEPLVGHVPGFRPRELRRLRSGQRRPEVEVDLHRLDREAARRELHATLVAAAESGLRCVCVIHGGGRHSEGGRPVLKSLLPEWLAEPPSGPLVLAFAPAAPADGASGATYVWLR